MYIVLAVTHAGMAVHSLASLHTIELNVYNRSCHFFRRQLNPSKRQGRLGLELSDGTNLFLLRHLLRSKKPLSP